MAQQQEEREQSLRQRFKLDQPTAEERARVALAPEVKARAEAYYNLARRFQLGITWESCVEAAKEGNG